MATLQNRIKERRNNLGYTLLEIAEKLNVKEATVQRYESGEIKNIKHQTIIMLAKILKCSPQYLMGWSNDINDNENSGKKTIRIPVLGCVRAGYPIEAVENILDYEEIPEELARQGEFFALRVKGDSMEPRFMEGDVVIVRKQEYIDNGDIAIMLINGDESTIKKVQKFKGGINLIPFNTNYNILTFTNKEIEQLSIRCIGKVVELRAKF